MSLIYLIMPAFLLANALSTRKDDHPSPDRTIVQAALNNPRTPTMFREPFLAAEQETRAMPAIDGDKGTGWQEKADGSRFFHSTAGIDRISIWKPWSWGS